MQRAWIEMAQHRLGLGEAGLGTGGKVAVARRILIKVAQHIHHLQCAPEDKTEGLRAVARLVEGEAIAPAIAPQARDMQVSTRAARIAAEDDAGRFLGRIEGQRLADRRREGRFVARIGRCILAIGASPFRTGFGAPRGALCANNGTRQ